MHRTCVCSASSWFGSRHSSFSDSSCNMSGAAEHSFYMGKGCVASINVGMPGGAVRGNRWNTHRSRLLHIFVTALVFSSDIIGMLVSEGGSVDEPYEDDDRKRFDSLFKEAFHTASEQTGASEHNEIQFFGARGNAAETVMVFKSHVNVTMLGTTILPSSWRRVEIALIEGATEHNDQVSMLIYNTHQPSARKRRFKPTKKIALCKHVLRHAISEHSARQNNVGFVFGGDANSMRSAWSTAVVETHHIACIFNVQASSSRMKTSWRTRRRPKMGTLAW